MTHETGRLRVCSLADLPRCGNAGGPRPPLAVFHTEHGVFAIDDTCTHQDASLADGWLEGDEVECPLHASRFDLRTGAVDAPPARIGVRAHRTEVVNGDVIVTISDLPPRLPPGSGG